MLFDTMVSGTIPTSLEIDTCMVSATKEATGNAIAYFAASVSNDPLTVNRQHDCLGGNTVPIRQKAAIASTDIAARTGCPSRMCVARKPHTKLT